MIDPDLVDMAVLKTVLFVLAAGVNSRTTESPVSAESSALSEASRSDCGPAESPELQQRNLLG